jgi:methylenetetrahydrofolate dehydrogenase (NADP+) / methenyltetrahydrofolate cyclohydrolase
MTATIIDGKGIAADLRGRVADAVHRLVRDRGITPGLAVVLVGNNPASESYVGSKMKMTTGSGMRSFDHRLPQTTSEAELLALIARLNTDPTVHGILVQLPLPPQIDPHKIINAIDPAKDVDGFHPVNAGRLSAGLPALAPCTPVGCVFLAKSVQPSLVGLEAVVVGRSNIVGKPLAQLLLAENATVTVAHSKTRDLPAVCRRADLLFAAVGRPEMVRHDWVKPGAVVIDVGRRHHAGAGWRGADDHRVPARQHPAGGLRARRGDGAVTRPTAECRPRLSDESRVTDQPFQAKATLSRTRAPNRSEERATALPPSAR